MKEDSDLRKIMVVVDQEGQIGLGFASFVFRNVQDVVGFVHVVDSMLPSVHEVSIDRWKQT